MNIEIERKFLVSNKILPLLENLEGSHFFQGYIEGKYFSIIDDSLFFNDIKILEPDKREVDKLNELWHEGNSFRIRISREKTVLNTKYHLDSMSCYEFEWQLDDENLISLIKNVCKKKVIKTRYVLILENKSWEIDVFEAENKGLITAEIELESKSDKINIPYWIENEVTGNKDYLNINLAR